MNLNGAENTVRCYRGSHAFIEVVLIKQLIKIEFLIIFQVHKRGIEPQRVALID
jgi:hypothetical protein